jgi:ATP phosphoribosyltransferase
MVVDLVESGETMRAAGLHAIATIMSSQAVLIANPRSRHPNLVATIVSRVRGVLAAGRHVLVKYNVERSRLKQATKITPGTFKLFLLILCSFMKSTKVYHRLTPGTAAMHPNFFLLILCSLSKNTHVCVQLK